MITAYAGIINKVLDIFVPFFKPSAVLARKRRRCISIADHFFDNFDRWCNEEREEAKRRWFARMLHYYHYYKDARKKLN